MRSSPKPGTKAFARVRRVSAILAETGLCQASIASNPRKGRASRHFQYSSGRDQTRALQRGRHPLDITVDCGPHVAVELPVTVISAKDRNFRPLAEIEDELRRRMSFNELAIAPRPDHRGKRLQQDVEIEPDRPVADVIQILSLLRLDIAITARRHLPKTGEAGRNA